jgi:hypothetical protein
MIDHHALTFEFLEDRIEARRREAHIVGLLRRAHRAERGDADRASAATDLSARLAPTAPTARDSTGLPDCCGPACCPAQVGA